MSRRTLAILLFLVVALDARFSRLRAEGPPQSNLATRSPAEALIAQLQSPNKPANPDRKTGGVRYPADYDQQAQRKVSEAKRALARLGKDAFPVLIDHMNDAEYSLSFSTSLLRDFSVGEVCYMILEGQIEPERNEYKARRGADGDFHTMQGYLDSYYKAGQSTKDQMSRWWAEHRDKTITEMQIEALQWTIEEEKRIGFPEPGNREEYLDPLVRKLGELKKE